MTTNARKVVFQEEDTSEFFFDTQDDQHKNALVFL
jgi:hypothetical protein